MAKIEGFRVRNYRALRDIQLGRVGYQAAIDPLTPLVVVIGKNGSGKSTLFDAFGFIADCLAHDVEEACNLKQRGGFDRLRSKGCAGPVIFEIYYRESRNERPITYELSIDRDNAGRPNGSREVLLQRRKGQKQGRPYPFLRLESGQGFVWAGQENVEIEGQEDTAKIPINLTDPRRLAIATLGVLKEHPRISRFREFLKGWYLSYFTPDAARSLPMAGPQKHLNMHGDNIGNVVQFMEREHRAAFKKLLQKIADKIPGIKTIDTHRTDDNRVLLRFNDGAFKDPFYAQQMSDGTLKIFAYLLLLEDPDPPPFICIEEPENGLYHKLLDALAIELREHATGGVNGSQIFVTTHQPYFVDALSPQETWVLEKGPDGFSRIGRAADDPLIVSLIEQGLPLGGLWYSDYLDGKQQ